MSESARIGLSPFARDADRVARLLHAGDEALLRSLTQGQVPTRLLSQLIAADPSLLDRPRLAAGLLTHPRLPSDLARRLVPRASWTVLAEAARAPRTTPTARAAAQRALLSRLPTLASGERRSLARRARGEVLEALLADSDPLVARAARENPRAPQEGAPAAGRSGPHGP